MTTLGFRVRRVIVFGGFAIAAAIGPTVAASIGAEPTDTPMATCPPGEHQDPSTLACVPGPAPVGVDVAPGLNQQWVEQDVYGTPGEQPAHAGGTTVP
ncbi:hypothetical protein [Mycolicibacterium hippocampi]|uniref:hypothetical protein n=1 Tax=Mycolicibacterium hippocampi TaxID=659824 RepID=UPI003510F636